MMKGHSKMRSKKKRTGDAMKANDKTQDDGKMQQQ